MEAEAKASRDGSGACDPKHDFPRSLGNGSHFGTTSSSGDQVPQAGAPRLQWARKGEPRGEGCRTHISTNQDKDKLFPPA